MALAPPERAKKITIYRNGDKNFTGKPFVVNRKRCPTWDSLLDGLTYHVRSEEAVRSIRTPTGGSEVRGLEQLIDNQDYVAVSRGTFRRLGYSHLNNNALAKKITSPRNYNNVKPVEHSRIQVSGRIRKVRTDVLTIYVFTNGEDLRPARRVTLNYRTLNGHWPAILQQIDMHVPLTTGACRKLYTLDGDAIDLPTSLKNNEYYVAVADRFKHVNYGNPKPQFRTFPKREPRYTELPPVVAPRRNRRHHYGDHSHTVENSLTSTGSTDRSMGSQRTYPGARHGPQQQRYRRHQPGQKKDDGVFHAKPVKYKRSSDRQREVDYDHDEGGVFKAKGGSQQAWGAREVEEGKDTQVELPIDQVEAEEVEDEEVEVELNKKHQRSKPHKKESKKQANKRPPQPRSPTPTRASTPHRTPIATPRSSKPPTPQSRQQSRTSATRPNSITLSSHTPSPGPAQSADDNKSQHSRPASASKSTPPISEAPSPAPTEHEAATKIQASYKGYHTRKSLKENQSKDNESQAATKIQATYRGYSTRKHLTDKKNEENKAGAAIKIQANYRGYRARKRLRDQANEHFEEEYSPEKEPDVVVAESLEDSEEMNEERDTERYSAAATQIQANYRGYRARKQLKQQKHENKPGTSDTVEE